MHAYESTRLGVHPSAYAPCQDKGLTKLLCPLQLLVDELLRLGVHDGGRGRGRQPARGSREGRGARGRRSLGGRSREAVLVEGIQQPHGLKY